MTLTSCSRDLSATRSAKRSRQDISSMRTRKEIRHSSNAAESLTLPAVRMNHSGLPRWSQIKWSLVVKPPRERPSAWSSSSFFLALRQHGDEREYRSHQYRQGSIEPFGSCWPFSVASRLPAPKCHASDNNGTDDRHFDVEDNDSVNPSTGHPNKESRECRQTSPGFLWASSLAPASR